MTRNYIDQRAAPSQSAADVLPRPNCGNGNGQAKHETPQQPTERPNGDVRTELGAGSFSVSLAMIAALPLSDAEKSDAVRRLMAEQTAG